MTKETRLKLGKHFYEMGKKDHPYVKEFLEFEDEEEEKFLKDLESKEEKKKGAK